MAARGNMKILETKRLLLRHMEMSDLDAMYALYSDPEMRLYFPDGTLTYEETKEEVEWFLNGHPEHPELGLWTTILKENNQIIGRCGLLPWTIDGRYEVEVAYMIDKAYWRQGLGAEAAQAVLEYGFNQLGLTRLVCFIDQNNAASIGVAKKSACPLNAKRKTKPGHFKFMP
jgi:ribosomal-protein-alanine N-acetyltransferase